MLNVVLNACIKDGKILLVKRAKEPYKDKWGLPAGKIEFGEHVKKASLREFREETGIDAEFKGIKGIFSEVVRENDDAKLHFFLYLCRLKADTDEIKPNDEGEFRWFRLEELENFKEDFIVSDFHLLKKAILEDKEIDMHHVEVEQTGDKLRWKSIQNLNQA